MTLPAFLFGFLISTMNGLFSTFSKAAGQGDCLLTSVSVGPVFGAVISLLLILVG